MSHGCQLVFPIVFGHPGKLSFTHIFTCLSTQLSDPNVKTLTRNKQQENKSAYDEDRKIPFRAVLKSSSVDIITNIHLGIVA